MRQDYQQYTQRGAEILAVGQDSSSAFKRLWEQDRMPFVGLSDPKSRVSDTYQQEVNLLKLGRMPAIFVIDLEGNIRYLHYGDAMWDIPDNKEILGVLDQIIAELL